MRTATAIAVIFAAATASASPLTVPKTSDATLATDPLKTGEMAYRTESDAAVSLFVADEGTIKQVIDPMSIRGYQINIVPRSEMSLTWDKDVRYSKASDRWTFCNPYDPIEEDYAEQIGVTNRVIVTCRSHVKIADVVYDEVNQQPTLGQPKCGRIWVDITGNAAIIYAVKDYSGTLTMGDLSIYTVTSGDKAHTNDLTRLVVPTLDSMGLDDLGHWREWAYNCRNGNLGEDWSKYPGAHTVKMKNGSGFFFDRFAEETGRYGIWQNSETNLVVAAGDMNALEISFSGIATNSLRFTSCVYSNDTDTAWLGWNVVADPSAFDLSLLEVQYAQYLSNATWRTAANAVKTRTMIKVPNVSDLIEDVSECYWRLRYNGVVSHAMKTTVNGDLFVSGTIYTSGGCAAMREVQTKLTAGAGIAIENGVISATGGGGPEISVADQPIPYNEGGVAFAYSATGTLAFTGDWPKGKPIYLSGTLASGASIAADVRILGYDSIPVDTPVQCVAWKSGATWFVNVISGL